ncbi:hypothetical protein BDZ89DRAFT_1057160 [Hymenopellis radicata]|nr:hypothetical protein BDZ89DRAFT_1057160 [Hymenopellis radicata]
MAPPAPPSSPAQGMRRPHVVVHPPEEDEDEPWCCFNADEGYADGDLLEALDGLETDAEEEEDDDGYGGRGREDSEIYEVVRVRRRDCTPTPPPRARRSRSIFFAFKKKKEQEQEQQEPERCTSPTPSFLSRRFSSFFSSSPSLPRMSTSSTSLSDSGPETPTDPIPPKPSRSILRRLSSFRKAPPKSATPKPPSPTPTLEPFEGEMRLDSLHFEEGISFDVDRF